MRSVLLSLAAVLAFPTPTAQAQSIRINGGLDSLAIITDGSSTRATGFLSDANTNVGVIDDTEINGSLKQSVILGSVVTSATSLKTDADTEIGTVLGSSVDGQANRTIVVGNVTTSARRAFATAVTKIGTIENARIHSGFDQTIVVGEVVTDANHINVTARTCIGTIKGGDHSAVTSLNLGDVSTKTKSKKFLGVSLGPVGSSKETHIEDQGC